MKYSVDTYEMVFPKYAKLQLKINKAGNLIIGASPSLTPGQMPPGVQGGRVPKGTKVFNYEDQILVSLTFADCLNIVNFAKSKMVTSTVDIFRNSTKFNKKVSFVFAPKDDKPLEAKFATIYFSSTATEKKEIKFKLPISLVNLDELAQLVESYINSYQMIKLYCLSNAQEEEPTHTTEFASLAEE
jgi:hypothetical protein